jgi:hypothetical protein
MDFRMGCEFWLSKGYLSFFIMFFSDSVEAELAEEPLVFGWFECLKLGDEFGCVVSDFEFTLIRSNERSYKDYYMQAENQGYGKFPEIKPEASAAGEINFKAETSISGELEGGWYSEVGTVGVAGDWLNLEIGGEWNGGGEVEMEGGQNIGGDLKGETNSTEGHVKIDKIDVKYPSFVEQTNSVSRGHMISDGSI